jgi:hypothetical protein
MSKRFRIDLYDSHFGTNGVYTNTVSGEAVLVDGREMVWLPHGSIVPDQGFHATLPDACRAAAGRVEAIGHRLLAQAERLRAEAASLEGGA